MGYYVRILTPEIRPTPTELLEAAAKPFGAAVTGELGVPDWEELLVTDSKGQNICAIQRNVVSPDSPAEEELSEFRDALQDCLPKTGVDWLLKYLERVRTIYAFQVLSGTHVDSGWDTLDAVKDAIHNEVGGIFQADNEGFSNEEGYHIVWQFFDDVTGPYSMAVLKGGKWIAYEMELGNTSHRNAFQSGEVPAGVDAGN
jgi:hypothetical protein